MNNTLLQPGFEISPLTSLGRNDKTGALGRNDRKDDVLRNTYHVILSEAHVINGFHSTHAKPWLLREEGEQYISANSTHALFAYCEVNEGIGPPDVVTENGVALAPFEKNNGAKLQAAYMWLA